MCISCRIIIYTYIVILYVCITGIKGICKDYLSEKNFITVDHANNSIERVTDCGQLVSQHSHLCKKFVGRRKCCQSCLDAETCVDDLSQRRLAIRIRDGSGNVIDRVRSCKRLVRKYPVQCEYLHVKWKKCCKSCRRLQQKQDLSCIDNDLKIWNVRGTIMKCPELVAQDVCRCHEVLNDVDKHCCHTCRNTDTEICFCQDRLSKYLTHKIQVMNRKTGKTETKVISSCTDIVNNHVEYCALGPGGLGGRDRKCCRSCKDKCVDSPIFKTTVSAGDNTCENCTCKELRDYGEDMLRTACGKKEIKDICCKSCNEIDS